MPDPDRKPAATDRGRSVFSRFAAPYTFSPDLSFGEALIAVAACLTRVFSACVLFSVWGAFSVFAWSAISGRFWRAVAMPPLILLFLVALAILMSMISVVQRAITPKR
jgi:hypothetical protein